ncbi:MAG: hypothetical protein R3F59_24745 [Myxococcota bacterium]
MLFPLTCAATAAAAWPPATVVDQSVEIVIAPDRSAARTTTWTVRIDDPAALGAGVRAPPGLEGAEDQGARVVDGVLLLGEDTAAGAVLTLTAREPVSRGPGGEVFLTSAELPTEHASFTVTAPLSAPLSLWSDPSAVPSFDTGRGTRRLGLQWQAVPADGLGQAAWSTFTSWDEASAGLQRVVDRKLAEREALGRAVAQDIEGLGVAGIVERVFAQVALDPDPADAERRGTWAGAHDAARVAADGQGTAAERGLVLISALKSAGIAARPAWFRPRDQRARCRPPCRRRR